MNPMIFDMLMHMDIKGVVIEAFGIGGLSYIRRDLTGRIVDLLDHGISVVVCSQCLYERSDFSVYEVGKRALEHGVIEAFDMTSEACVTDYIPLFLSLCIYPLKISVYERIKCSIHNSINIAALNTGS